MGKRRITSKPGWLGYTYYYDEKGQCVGKSRPGAFGTTVYFDERGRFAGKSRKGLLVERVYTDKNYKRSIKTYKGIVGESHYENGKSIGRSAPGWFSTVHTTLETEDEIPEEEYYAEDFCEWDLSEDQEYEDFEDEEVESVDYEEDTPEISQDTVVENFQLLLLCLGICMAIAAIYAIVKFN